MKMPGRENRTAVVVGTVTDDVRIQDIPKLKVRNCLFLVSPCKIKHNSVSVCDIVFLCFPIDLCSESNQRCPPQDPEGWWSGDDI